MNYLFTMAAFVLLPAVTRAFGVSADLALFWLHSPFFVAESARTGCRVIAVPVCSGGHLFVYYASVDFDRYLDNPILLVHPFLFKEKFSLKHVQKPS